MSRQFSRSRTSKLGPRELTSSRGTSDANFVRVDWHRRCAHGSMARSPSEPTPAKARSCWAAGPRSCCSSRDPVVARGVAAHSDFADDPMRRLRHTLGVRLRDRARRRARRSPRRRASSTARTPGPGRLRPRPSALGRGDAVPAGVACTRCCSDRCRRHSPTRSTPRARGSAPRCSCRRGCWPADRAAFARYWKDAVAALEVSDEARAVARDLLHPGARPALDPSRHAARPHRDRGSAPGIRPRRVRAAVAARERSGARRGSPGSRPGSRPAACANCRPGVCSAEVSLPLSEAANSVLRMAHRHHTIDYIELPVDDVAAAKTFYSDAFGWTFTDYGPDYAGIQDPKEEGGEVGGLNGAGTEGRGNGPLVQLYSDDLEASVAAVTGAGGNDHRGPVRVPGRPPVPLQRPGGQRAGSLERGVGHSRPLSVHVCDERVSRNVLASARTCTLGV